MNVFDKKCDNQNCGDCSSEFFAGFFLDGFVV